MNIESMSVGYEKEYGFSGSIKARYDDGDVIVEVEISVSNKVHSGEVAVSKCMIGLAQDACDTLSNAGTINHRANDFNDWVY